MKQTNNTPVKQDANNASILEAYSLFNSTLDTDVKIRTKCEEYIKQMILSAPDNVIEMLGDEGECVSVTYDGGNHPEYASNAYSIVNAVFLDDEKNICLSTEDCDDYSLENIDTDEVYAVATFIYEVLNHNEFPETSDEPENASEEPSDEAAPIWLLFYEVVKDYELIKRQIKVYHNYEKALKEFRAIVELEQKKASDEELESDYTEGSYFESYEDGYFAQTHAVVELSESTMSDDDE